MLLNRPFESVTPTLDGAVLAVLASSDAWFTVPELRGLAGRGSDEGLRKVLARLATNGIVLRQKVGRTGAYRLNREHLAAAPVVALARLNETFLDRLAAEVGKWEREPLYGAVFGSAATGLMHDRSDIDLLLVQATPESDAAAAVWDEEVAELVRAVSAWTGNDARPVAYTIDELREAAAERQPLLQDVVRDGLTFAGERSWFMRQVRGGT